MSLRSILEMQWCSASRLKFDLVIWCVHLIKMLHESQYTLVMDGADGISCSSSRDLYIPPWGDHHFKETSATEGKRVRRGNRTCLIHAWFPKMQNPSFKRKDISILLYFHKEKKMCFVLQFVKFIISLSQHWKWIVSFKKKKR